MSIEYGTLQTLDTLLSRLRDFQDLVTIGTDRVAGYAEVSVNHPDVFHELPSRRVSLPIEVHADWHARTSGVLARPCWLLAAIVHEVHSGLQACAPTPGTKAVVVQPPNDHPW